MRSEWETPPTVEGIIVSAWSCEDGDVLLVQGLDVADDVGNLIRVIDEPENPDPNRPFLLVGRTGTIALHGYSDPSKLIGKRCLIYSDDRFDIVAIEPDKEQEVWDLVVWREYFDHL